VNTPLLVLGLGGWTPCCCEWDILSPPWDKWKEKRETKKVRGVETVQAIVDLIAQAKEEEEQARERGDTETM